MTLIEVSNKLTQASNSLESIFIRVVNRNEDYLQELITSQLRVGKQGDGRNISPKYTTRYARKKSSMGSQSSPVPDLKLTGKFWDAIGVDGNSDLVFQIGTDDSNQADLGAILEDRYGSKIYELTPANRKLFIENIINEVKIELYGIIN